MKIAKEYSFGPKFLQTCDKTKEIRKETGFSAFILKSSQKLPEAQPFSTDQKTTQNMDQNCTKYMKNWSKV